MVRTFILHQVLLSPSLQQQIIICYSRKPVICCHLDLKPDNIVVISSGSKSPYVGQWKICDFGISATKLKMLGADQDAKTVPDAPTPLSSEIPPFQYRPPELINTDDDTCSSTRSFDIWAMGCILMEFAMWVATGEIHDMAQTASHSPTLESKLQYPVSQYRANSETTKCDFFEAERKAKRTKEELLEQLGRMPESITKSIAKSVIAPMLEAPENYYSWRSIRDKARVVLSACWADYKKAIAKAATPLLSFVRPKHDDDDSLSSIHATNGEDSVATESTLVDSNPITSPPVKAELRGDAAIEPNISSKKSSGSKEVHKAIKPDIYSKASRSKHVHKVIEPEGSAKSRRTKHIPKVTEPNISTKLSTLSYSMERYIRDTSDYTSLMFAGASSANLAIAKELRKVRLKRIVDTLERFDKEFD
jgi:serine/threonine protein kinase